MTRIGLVGDRSDDIVAHRAIEASLLQLEVGWEWLGTDRVGDGAALAAFDGLWCVPGSPYRDLNGALAAISFARLNRVPFLGTCGGFQHAVIEYARNVLGWADADHAESAPGVGRSVIAPLACALRGVSEPLRLVAGSKLAQAYGSESMVGTYQCSYGLNPEFAEALTAGALRVAAFDHAGAVRALEHDRRHPFFVGTLFQPEREALSGPVSPLVRAFVTAAAPIAASLDITKDVCPMTYVRVKLALERLSPGQKLEVWLTGDEPLRNVPKSSQEDGHRVLTLEPDASSDRCRLLIQKNTGVGLAH